jgi:hypothetical protein
LWRHASRNSITTPRRLELVLPGLVSSAFYIHFFNPRHLVTRSETTCYVCRKMRVRVKEPMQLLVSEWMLIGCCICCNFQPWRW